MSCITGMYLLQWVLADTSCRFAEKNSSKINFEGKKNSQNCQYQSVIRGIQSVIRGNESKLNKIHLPLSGAAHAIPTTTNRLITFIIGLVEDS